MSTASNVVDKGWSGLGDAQPSASEMMHGLLEDALDAVCSDSVLERICVDLSLMSARDKALIRAQLVSAFMQGAATLFAASLVERPLRTKLGGICDNGGRHAQQ